MCTYGHTFSDIYLKKFITANPILISQWGFYLHSYHRYQPEARRVTLMHRSWIWMSSPLKCLLPKWHKCSFLLVSLSFASKASWISKLSLFLWGLVFIDLQVVAAWNIHSLLYSWHIGKENGMCLDWSTHCKSNSLCSFPLSLLTWPQTRAVR